MKNTNNMMASSAETEDSAKLTKKGDILTNDDLEELARYEAIRTIEPLWPPDLEDSLRHEDAVFICQFWRELPIDALVTLAKRQEMRHEKILCENEAEYRRNRWS